MVGGQLQSRRDKLWMGPRLARGRAQTHLCLWICISEPPARGDIKNNDDAYNMELHLQEALLEVNLRDLQPSGMHKAKRVAYDAGTLTPQCGGG